MPSALSADQVRKKYQGKHAQLGEYLRELIEGGWRITSQGDGVMVYCPHQDRSGCHKSVAGTPRSTGHAVTQLKQFVSRCPHHPESREEIETT